MHIDVQFNPAAAPWPVLRDAAGAAEQAGFGAIWAFDHLAGSSMSGTGMLECFTFLGALAASTSEIELGTLVANVWNREPGVLAVAAASVCEIAGRALLLGLGAGASPTSRFAFEQHAVGSRVATSLDERHARVAVTLDVIDEMFAPERDERFATFPLPRCSPTTLLGVNSVRLATLAGARTGGVNVWWGHPRRQAILSAAEAARPRSGAPFLRTTYRRWDVDLLDPSHPDRLQMAEARIDRLILSETGVPDARAIARLHPA